MSNNEVVEQASRKNKGLWAFGGWLIGSVASLIMPAFGVKAPWNVIAQLMIYFIGFTKAGWFEGRHYRLKNAIVSGFEWVLENSRTIFVMCLLLLAMPYLSNLGNIKTIVDINYDRTLPYSGQLSSIEYVKNSLFGLFITDTRLLFQDGTEFTISGQYDYLLNATYTVFYTQYSANKTTILEPVFFPLPSIVQTRQVYESKVLNITLTEVENP